jgi:hypothetical protein
MPEMTIKQIARDLGLSIAAVSAALGTQSTSKVSAGTALRVQAYARKVNYRPSLIGRSMRSQRLRQKGFGEPGRLGIAGWQWRKSLPKPQSDQHSNRSHAGE